MTKDEVKREVVRLWRQLPSSDRRTDDQAALFALKLSEMDGFRDLNGDPYQSIHGWLKAHLGEP